MTADGEQQGSISPRRPGRSRRGVPARVRILLWLVVVMAVALGSVAVMVRAILIAEVEGDGNQLLEQEAREFEQFARVGRDPATARPFTNAGDLLFTHLQRQHADDDELLLGVHPDGRVMRQARVGPYNLPDDATAMRDILSDPSPSGRTDSPVGEIRWAKVRAVTAGGDARPGTFVIAYFIERDFAEVDRMVRVMGGVSAAALLCGAGIAWIVSGRILAPVRLVRRTAAEITEQDLARRIPVPRRDDVGELAATFNAMLDRLDRAFATQRRFLDDAGHELRTPITIVRGHLELLGTGGPEDTEERAETMRLVTDELDRMSRIVEDLLLLAKAERPDFVQPQWVPVTELTSDIYAKVRALGDRAWVLDGIGEGEARVDPQRVTQAIAQLAHNAVQHTAPGDVVKVGSALDDARVRFWVADSGPGVHPDDAERVFERFTHGIATSHGARTRTGAGLGLAIVAAIAAGHDGTVRLRATDGMAAPPGATFELDLPRTGRGGGGEGRVTLA